jgi:hypothetical protein
MDEVEGPRVIIDLVSVAYLLVSVKNAAFGAKFLYETYFCYAYY